MTTALHNPPPALLCDEMLLGLGKWLRAAGYDTALAPIGAGDRLLVEQAMIETRLFLSRDTHLPSIRHADKVLVLLRGNAMPAWVDELALRPGINWLMNPFSRCLLCNRPLSPGSTGYAIPEWVTEKDLPTWHCPGCRKAYWQGGHVHRMLTRLHAFAELGERMKSLTASAEQDGSDRDC